MSGSRTARESESMKLATLPNEVIQMKTWKIKIARRKTDYRALTNAAKAIDADIEHYTEVRAKILKEVLEVERFHALPVGIPGKEGLQ